MIELQGDTLVADATAAEHERLFESIARRDVESMDALVLGHLETSGLHVAVMTAWEPDG